MRILLSICALLLLAATPALAAREARLISFPAVSSDGSTVYFTCWGDIWSAPRNGSALATRLSDNVAYEGRPTLSPDGSKIAFVSDRFGSYDIFVMPASGGEATRLTWHMTTDYVYDWKPDGTAILGYAMEQDLWAPVLYEYPLDGSQPRRLSGPDHDDNVFGSYLGSPTQMVYSRGPGDWSRQNYRGSTSYDLWTFDSAARLHSALVEGDTNDMWPQPSPDGRTVYFVSDRAGKGNLWACDLASGRLTQLTSFTDNPVLWPRISADGDEIAFERLGQLWIYSIPGGEAEQVRVQFADDSKRETELDTILPNNVSEYSISPNGNYIAAVVFGDIYILKNPEKYPPDEQPDQDLSRTHHVIASPGREWQIAWHPDSRMITYISDRDGEYDVFTFDMTQRAEGRITQSPQEEWLPNFDPTGQLISYYSGNRSLRVYDPKSATETVVAEGTLKLGPWQLGYEWSPDGRWIAFGEAAYGWEAEIMVVGLEDRIKHNVSMSPDWDFGARWSPDGKYLAWSEERDSGSVAMLVELNPEGGTYDTDLLFPADKPKSPEPGKKEGEEEPAAEADSTAAEGQAAAEGTEAGGTAAEGGGAELEEWQKPKEPVLIDFEEIHRRSAPLLTLGSSYWDPVWSPDSKFLVVTTMPEAEPEWWTVTVEDRTVQRLGPTRGGGALQFAPDNSRLYFLAGDALNFFQLQGPSAAGGGMQMMMSEVQLDQYAIWQQVMADGWRQLRDGFYDPAMHGVDWAAALRKYMPLVQEAGTYEEFGTLYRRMLGELGASHLGYGGFPPETEAPPEITADFGVLFDEGYSGEGWLVDRVFKNGPADMAGSELYEGDVILSVNGEAVNSRSNRGRVLRNLSGHPVKLHVRSSEEYIRKLSAEASEIAEVPYERDVVIMPSDWGSVRGLEYEDWVRDNRSKVSELSEGRIAYQHIAGMNGPSLERFRRELFTESRGKDALIIDVRFNGGGNTHEQLVDLIDKRAFTIEQHRDSPEQTGPIMRWEGPIVVLINAHSYSDAEIFPNVMKDLGLATVMGETTGGNVIGTYDFPLMDGSTLRMPSWGWYRLNRENMEGNGATPDIYVHIDPNGLERGHDNQLEAAVEFLRSRN